MAVSLKVLILTLLLALLSCGQESEIEVLKITALQNNNRHEGALILVEGVLGTPLVQGTYPVFEDEQKLSEKDLTNGLTISVSQESTEKYKTYIGLKCLIKGRLHYNNEYPGLYLAEVISCQ